MGEGGITEKAGEVFLRRRSKIKAFGQNRVWQIQGEGQSQRKQYQEMSKEAGEQRCRRCVGRKSGTLRWSTVIVKMLHSRSPHACWPTHAVSSLWSQRQFGTRLDWATHWISVLKSKYKGKNNKKDVVSQCKPSVGKSTRLQSWWPKFDLQDLLARRSKQIFKVFFLQPARVYHTHKHMFTHKKVKALASLTLTWPKLKSTKRRETQLRKHL